MGLLDRIIDRFRPKEPPKPDPQGILALYDAPADYNRATRRRNGMLSKVWRWDLPTNYVPRYIRRHYNAAFNTDKETRRVHRQRARITRIALAKGMPGVQS